MKEMYDVLPFGSDVYEFSVFGKGRLLSRLGGGKCLQIWAEDKVCTRVG